MEQQHKDHDEQQIGLFTLSWDDIMFSNLLPYLNWKDLFTIRSTCWEAKQMLDAYFQQLRFIDLTSVHNNFTDEAFQLLTIRCTNLRKLVINRARWIIDVDLSKLFRNNCSLSHLDLSRCECLNGSCLLPLAVNCKQLHTLVLAHCNWLTPGAMETLITHLDSLVTVNLTGCCGISNQLLLPFFQKFHRLKKLHLAHLSTVNDTTMLLISRNRGDSLELLDVCGCQNVTDRGIKMVAEYCANLQALHVAGSNLITEHSLGLLRARGVHIDRAKAGELVPFAPFYLQV